MLKNITKLIAGLVPGTPVNLAQQKRDFEKRLRAQGYSRTHAKIMTSQHFRKGTQDYANKA